METSKPKNQSSLGASIGSALSGAAGHDGAQLLPHFASAELVFFDEKAEPFTTLDRGPHYLP